MPIDKLPEFSKNGQKNTDGLDQEDGFPVNLKPARQWFNFLFNKVTSTINQLIDQDYIRHDEIIDNLTTDDAAKPLSAKQGKKLQDEKFAKSGGSVSGSVQLTSDNTVLTVGIDRDIGFVKKQGAGGVLAIAKDRIFRIVGGNKAEISADASDTFTDLLSLNGSGVLSTPGGFSGNASSASKLQQQRKIFGQDFDGTNDVAGNITTTTGMVASDSYHYIDFGRNSVDRINFVVYGGIFNFINAQNGSIVARLNSNGIDCNAASASKLQILRTINFSGAATGSFNFDGTASVGCILTLANSGVTAGTYASTIQIPQITLNDKGLITSVSQQNIRTATTTQTGVVQLVDDLTTDDSARALTAKQGKVLQDEKFPKTGGKLNGNLGVRQWLDIGNGEDTKALRGLTFYNLNKIAASLYVDADNNFAFEKANSYTFDKSINASITGNSASATKLQNPINLWGNTFNGTTDISETLDFGDAGTRKILIKASSTTDGGFVAVGNTGTDVGYVELGTIDDAITEVWATQRNGINGDILRKAKLLDVDGNTSFPNNVSMSSLSLPSNCGLRYGGADAVSYDGVNLDIISWQGIGIWDSCYSKRTMLINARTGDVFTKGTIQADGDLISSSNVRAKDITALGWMYASRYVGKYGDDAEFKGNLTGNASTSTKLETARNIALSGAVSGSANFDGSGNITITTTANNAIGVGQSWSDVTSQRANNTTYTNTTGRPIQLFISVNVGGQGDDIGTFNIDGVVMTIRDAAAWSHLSFIIPNGSSYKLSVNASQYNLLTWAELR